MAIIRPPISGDSPQDSWMNQVTEAINKGLLAPSVNPSEAAVISVDSFSAATVYLYTRTTTAVAPAAIAQDLTYDYSQAGFTTSPPFGSANWETSPPGTVNGDYLWITTVNISANVGQEIIPAASWSTPEIFAVNGSSSIVIEAYLRAASAPSTPTGGSYDFATKTLTPPAGGWSQTFPSGSDPVYIVTTIATISGTTGTDSNLTWSAPVKMVEDGTPATEVESGLVYYTQASASNPGTPTATSYNFTTGAFTGLTSGWQTSPVTVNITSTTALFWSSRFRVIEPPTGSPTVTFDTPIASVNFGTNIQSDNYIAGSSGWQIQRSSGDAEFNNITARGTLKSGNFDGQFNSLNNTISTYTSSSGALSSNYWALRDGFANNANSVSLSSWTSFVDPVSNTDHVVLWIRTSSAAQTEIVSQLGRGQEVTLTRNSGNFATYEVWNAGYLPEDTNSAYVQLRTLVSSTGSPASGSLTLTASNVVDPGTTGYFFSDDKSVINSGTLDVANIRINGSIQAKNLDIGITLQSKSGSRSNSSGGYTDYYWKEFLRLETSDNPDYSTDISFNASATTVSEGANIAVAVFKVLSNSFLGTEGSAIYSYSTLPDGVGSNNSNALCIARASVTANSNGAASSFTCSTSGSNVNVTRNTYYIFCWRRGGDLTLGDSGTGSITEVRRPA